MEHNNNKIVGYQSSSSSSSSSFSNRFEVDIGEDDASYYEFEENDSNSVVLNSESPSTLSQAYDLDTVYGSIKRSPPVQVMGQPAGYDVNNSLKHRSNSEWSLGSSDSLFSIRTGNNSFSLDGSFYLSKSGELRFDDGSCFAPDGNKLCLSPSLPTVMDASAENKRKSDSTNSESGEKEETMKTIETENVSVVDSEKEKGNLSASLSTDSFAFPVLAGDGSSPTKAEAGKQQSAPSTPPAEAAAQTTPKAPPAIPKAGGNQWFHCFSCFPMCC